MECVLAKNGRNSSLHNGLKGYLEIATGDPKLVDNLALKGWLRGQSESLKAEYPNMPTDENNEAIVFYHNESVRSDSNNLTLDVAAVADKIDQWKPVFLKDSNSIVQADNPYFLGYVPSDNTIPVFEESIQKLIDRPVALGTVPIKEGVPELFESNPELANAVYETVGINQLNSLDLRNVKSTLRVNDIANANGDNIFEIIKNKTSNEIHEYLFFLQSRIPNKRDLSFKIVTSDDFDGEYNQKTNEISINSDVSNERILEVILHELTHAATFRNIHAKQYPFYWMDLSNERRIEIENSIKELEYIRKFILEKVPSYKDLYELTNTDEFVAALYTNIKFQKLLASVYNSKGENIFIKLSNIIKKILGISYTNTLLDHAFKASFNLFEKPQIKLIIDPDEKQQAQQLYSSYLQTTNNPTIEGFKKFIQGKQPVTPRQGIAEVFAENPQLAAIGTQEQYERYLSTIFPNSQVTDIVYHVTDNEFDEFVKGERNKDGRKARTEGLHFIGKGGLGFYKEVFEIGDDRIYKYGRIVKSAILNFKNPQIKNTHDSALEYLNESTIRKLRAEGYDSAMMEVDDNVYEYIAFESEDVYTLGSKRDIEGFKNFVAKQLSQPIKEGVPELFESNPELANAVYEALGFKQVYHGSKTTEKYSDYKIPVNKGVDSLGSFFTSDLDGALMFTPDFIDESPIAKDVKERTGRVTYKKDRSYVKKEYLKLQNPYSVDIRKWEDNSWINDFVKGDFSIYNFNEVPSEIVDRVKKILIDRGHDGIYIAKDFYVGNMESRYDQYIVFDPNKTLKQQKQQALQLYSQYLNSIFPNSKVKDIVYHGITSRIKEKFDKFSKEFIKSGQGRYGENGFFFSENKEEVNKNYNNSGLISAVINLKNTNSDIYKNTWKETVEYLTEPQEIYGGKTDLDYLSEGYRAAAWYKEGNWKKQVEKLKEDGWKIEETDNSYIKLGKISSQEKTYYSHLKKNLEKGTLPFNINNSVEAIRKSKEQGLDGLVYENILEESSINKHNQYVVFEPEQIHILGGKQDIEGFKNFVNNQPSQPMYSRRNTGTATDEAALLTFARFLANKTGINFRLVTADEALRLNPNYNGEPGFFYNNVGYLVKGVANKSTALHEIFGHPMVELLEQQNLPLLHELFRAIPQSILDETKLAYPEHVLEDGTLDAIGMKEALIKAIEYEATNRLEAKDSTLKSLIDRLWMFISRLFNNTLDVKNLGRFTTIKEIADLAFNTSLLDTPLASNQVMYFKSTTQSETLQKFEAVFGHYSQARNADGVEVYTSSKNPSLVLKRLTEEVSRIFSNDIFGKSIDEWAANKATKYFQNPNAVFKDTDKSIETGSVQLATNKFYSYSELVDFYIRERNTNMRKGKLLHAIMEWILTMDTVAKDKILKGIIAMNDPEIVNGKIIADGIDTSMYDYLREVPNSENPTDEYELLKHITNVLRIRLNDPLAPDVLKNEYILGNNELGIATRADTIVFHADGSYSIFDWQGGNLHSDNAFAKTAMSFFTQHGAKKQVVSKLNIKQMEITMRMFLIKLEIPEVKAKRAEVFEIQNLSNSTIRAIEGDFDIQDYLSAIERWIEAEHPELIEKYRALNVFDRDNYMTSGMHAYDYIKEATKVVGVDANEAAKNLTKRLIAVSSGIQNLEKEGKNLQGLKTLKDERSVLLKQWGDLQRTNVLNVGIWNQTDDMEGGFLRLFNNRYDLSRYPQLQVIVDALSRAEYRALKRADDTRAEHNALLEDVIEDYKSIDPNIRTKIKIGLGNLKTFDYPIYKGDGTGFFDFAYIKKDFNGNIQLGWVMETDTEAWGKLTKAQRAYMNFINVEMRMAYKTAVIDTNITTLKRKNGSLEEVNVSKADLIGMSELGDNFLPYTPPLHEEYENRAMGIFGLLKDKLKNFSLYDVTEALNGKFSEHPGMPIRFLHASADIIEAEAHSLHVEHMFNTFVNQLYLVEELEEVVAVSKAFTEELEGMGKDENGDYNLINIIETMKDLTKMHATGRTTSGKETLKMGAMLGPENQIAAVNIDKAMAGLKTFTTYSSMLLSPVLAGANMATIALLNFKTAGVNSITSALSKQLGIKDDHVIDFTFTDMVNAHRDWAEIQALTVQHGADEKELNKNKMWQMLKAWRIFPDDYWFANSRNNDNVIKSTNLVTPETGMFLHLLGENYGVITTFAALVKKMEVQKGSIKKKVFDAYDVKDVATKSGKTIKKLVWNFGVRGVEVVKGTENDENKTTRLITELDSREIDYFKRAISKIHGDYRKSEKAIGEKHALFQWSLQFKKYLMRQLKNILDTKRYDSTLGHYDQVMDKDGKPVLIKVKDENGVETEESYMEWSARVTEGRYRTLINMIIEWLSLVDSPALQAWMKQKNLRLPVKGSYDWKNLSDDQKKNIVHVGMDLAFVLLGILGRLGFDEDDRNNKNPWYVQYIRLTENMSEGANPMDTFKAFKNSIPAIGRLTNIITYGSEFLFSVATGDRTQNGDLRGMNSLLNNLPLTNALRQVQRFDKQF